MSEQYISELTTISADIVFLILVESEVLTLQRPTRWTWVVLHGNNSGSRKGLFSQGWLVVLLLFWNLGHVLTHIYIFYFMPRHIIYWITVEWILYSTGWFSNLLCQARSLFLRQPGTWMFYLRSLSRFTLLVQ